MQGSDGIGFTFAPTSCVQPNSYSFTGNTAGSCKVAFTYKSLNIGDCYYVEENTGFAS